MSFIPQNAGTVYGKGKLVWDILAQDESQMIADIEIEVLDETVTTFSLEVSDSPVEIGADVSDHMRHKPVAVQMTGFVSDTPVKLLGGLLENAYSYLKGNTRAFSESPAEVAYRKLEELNRTKRLFTLVTSRDYFENVVLQDLMIVENAETAGGVQFRAAMRTIRLASPETMETAFQQPDPADATNADTSAKASDAVETTTKEADEETYQSFFKWGLRKLRGE